MEDVLELELCALSTQLRGSEIPLIVGGGYGLVLKDRFVRVGGHETLRPVPAQRTTEDIDLFLKAEVIVDRTKTEALHRALESLGYEPVESARHYQFRREVTHQGANRNVKIDLLAPLPQDRGNVKVDERRIRPYDFRRLHAHKTPEALTIEECLLEVPIGKAPDEHSVFIPHPYTYLVLKIFALRDRIDDEDTLYGRYHAFDMYRAVAMTTEQELAQVDQFHDKFGSEGPIAEAKRLAGDLFGDTGSLGVIRLQEHARDVAIDPTELDIEGFMDDLRFMLVGEG